MDSGLIVFQGRNIRRTFHNEIPGKKAEPFKMWLDPRQIKDNAL